VRSTERERRPLEVTLMTIVEWLDRAKSRVNGRRRKTANVVTLMRILL